MAAADTSWIIPGAKVVTYTIGGAGTPRNVTVQQIVRTAPGSFTVEDSTRFDLATQRYRHQGKWAPTTIAVPVDSEDGRRELDGMRRRKLHRRAVSAVEAWRKAPTAATREAAIRALQAIEDD